MIKRKKKICKDCELEKVIQARGRCFTCDKVYKNKDRTFTKNKVFTRKKRNYIKKKKRKRAVPSARQKKVREIDRDFSLLVRALGSSQGRVNCYTCGRGMKWKYGKGDSRAENGHLFSRRSMCLRWDKRNTEIQCSFCNCRLNGNLDIFRTNYIRDYGRKQYDSLALAFHQKVCRHSLEDLEKIHLPIREELKAVLKTKNL